MFPLPYFDTRTEKTQFLGMCISIMSLLFAIVLFLDFHPWYCIFLFEMDQ